MEKIKKAQDQEAAMRAEQDLSRKTSANTGIMQTDESESEDEVLNIA